MCHRLFIASERGLPLVPPSKPIPTFAIELISEEDRIRLPFSPTWQVVEAGSTSGCACDFHHRGGQGRQSLMRYLAALRGLQSIRVYSTWYGDEDHLYQELPPVTVEELGGDDDPFPPQSLISII
jgi:hypothetical protein